MKKTHILTGIMLLVVGLLLGRYLLPSTAEPDRPAEAPTAPVAAAIWTCSMHPQIQQPEAGDCPICGMDLIPLEADEASGAGPRVLSMSESSRALAEIQTTVVQRAYPEAEIRLVGKLGYDETQVKSLTARFPARIDTLYVNYTGIEVERGQHLAQVYSPELLTAQRELISAYQRDPKGALTVAARGKLRLWDLLPEQIEAILESGAAADHFELRAPINGVVVNKYVKEGDYVKTGEPLFRIVDLSELWLNLYAYESDLSWLRFGQEVAFSVEAYPGEVFSGPIIFIEPELDVKTRTVAVRVNVPNIDGRLKPGMFARGMVRSRIAEDGNVYAPDFTGKWISPMHPEIVKDAPGACDVCGMALVPAESLGYVSAEGQSAPLVVPASAVLRTGKRAVVYVARESKEAGQSQFEGREIVLGPRAGDLFVVQSGLGEGEEVVTQGAFKIDSALQIQAKPSMMNPEGGGPAAGHSHAGTGPPARSDVTDEGTAGHAMPAALEIDSVLAAKILPGYYALHAALADDALDAAQVAVQAMMAQTGHSGALPDLLHALLGAADLEAIRRPHFETLSNAVIAAVQADPGLIKVKAYRMHCPMVYGDHGADWLQQDETLVNPYFGAMMLHCGELREEVGE